MGFTIPLPPLGGSVCEQMIPPDYPKLSNAVVLRQVNPIFRKALDMLNGKAEFNSSDFEMCLEQLSESECREITDWIDRESVVVVTFWQKLIMIFKTLIGK